MSERVVTAIGRFNPPHVGHGLMIQTAAKKARAIGADLVIFIIEGANTSKDKAKNPLTGLERSKYLKQFFPGVRFETASNAYEAFWKLGQEGYKKLYLISGSDRADQYHAMLSRGMNNPNPDKKIDINAYDIIELSRNEDPDGSGVAAASATKMRNAAENGDYDTFKDMAPAGNENIIKNMFKAVSSSLKKFKKENK